MSIQAKEIDQILVENHIKYSICTLVNDLTEYQIMVDSFEKAGFKNEFCEFLYIDNSKGNKYDAYSGLNKLIQLSRGKHIILCHQDIELKFDNLAKLESKIKEVEHLDKNWGIISNAGGLHLKKMFKRITHPHEELNEGPFPFRVNSVDENFILLKKEANLTFSTDLSGYHMYGTDICIIADILGFSSWVIDFNLFHKSTGNMSKGFYKNKLELIKKYEKAFRPRYIRSTCTTLYISGSNFITSAMNTKTMVFLTKIKLKLKRLAKGDYLFNEKK